MKWARGLALIVFAALPSWASPSEAAKLFDEGRVAMKAGDLAKACDAFARSHALEPGLGTLLNLATCLEKKGKLTSAWLRFNDAAAWAQRTHDAEREGFARARAKELRPRVSWLNLSSAQELTVSVDGQPVQVSSVAVLVPVEVGAHTLVVEVAGLEPWQATVNVATAGSTVTQAVPRLAVSVPVPPPPPPPLVVAAPAPPPTPTQGGRSLLGLSLVAGGGAVAVLAAVGLVWSLGTYGSLQGQRLPDGAAPAVISYADFERVKWAYPASWAGLAVGLAAAGAGTFFLLRGADVSVTPMAGGVSVRGSF